MSGTGNEEVSMPMPGKGDEAASMPVPGTSNEEESTRKSGTEGFYMVGDKKQDAAFHEPILAGGTTDLEATRALARRLGYSEEQIDRLFKEENKEENKEEKPGS